MLIDIVEVKALEGHNLFLRFEDGAEGNLNLMEIIKFDGIFEPLKDRRLFGEIYINKDLGTICWPNGADLDPDSLYAKLSKTQLPTYK